MSYQFKQGFFKPKNPKKYQGDVKNIVYRSGWELKVMSFFDDNPAILKWASEELKIPYLSPKDNAIHNYFPDFLIEAQTKTGTQKYLVEVKPLCQTQPPVKKKKVTKTYINEVVTYAVNQAKFDAARLFCKKQGWEFLILTENDIYGT